jgi:hypothetical protein
MLRFNFNIPKSLIFGYIILSGCNGPAEFNNYELSEGQSIELKLDRFTSPAERYSQFHPNWNGKEVFAVHVKDQNVIKIYDLKSGQLEEELSYATEGPQAIPSVYYFHLHNEDSIFLSQSHHYKLTLTNKGMEPVNVFNLLPDEVEIDPETLGPTSENFGILTADSKRPLTILENKVIGHLMPFMSPYRTDASLIDGLFIQKGFLDGSMNFKVGYPQEMQGKIWGPMHGLFFSCFNKNNNQFIMSFAASENLQVYDHQLNYLFSSKANASKFKSIRPMSKPDSDPEVYKEYYMNQPVYGGIYHDVKNDIFYRIGRYPNGDDYDPYKSDYLDPMANPRDLVIIALNKDLNKIAEHTIKQPQDGVYFDVSFANENGLYISFVDFNDEDKLYFKNFKAIKK